MNDRKHRRALANTLRILRGHRTQKEVAAEAGIPTSTWCKLEQGIQLPRDTTFVKVASVFGLTPDELDEMVSRSTLADRQGQGGKRPKVSPPEAAFKHDQIHADLLGRLAIVRSHLDALELDIKRQYRCMTDPNGAEP